MEELKCPYCGNDDIRNDELLCTDKNENIVILNYKGICSNCNKPVYWEEEFKFHQCVLKINGEAGNRPSFLF